MNSIENKKLNEQLSKEIQEFRKRMQALPPKELYSKYYEINAMEELYNFMTLDGKKYNYNSFPKENILEQYYVFFLDSDYDLTYEDLECFMKEETKKFLKYNKKQNEM